MKKFICVFILVFIFISVYANTKATVKTTGSLNIRVRANTTCDVVGHLKNGDSVDVVSFDGIWAKIVAPKNIKVFIYTSLLDGNMTKSKANLRCGAGTNFQSYGIIPEKTQLKLVGESKNSWTQIEPLSTMTVYVAKSFLTIDNKATNDNASSKNDDKSTTVKDIPTVDIPDKSTKRTLIFSDKYQALVTPLEKAFSPAKEATLQGKIARCKTNASHPIKYALKLDNSTERYLIVGEFPDFYYDQHVTLKGNIHTVQNWKNPVIVAKEIEITK